MRNVRFSYELPFSLLKREKIANATVFISGDNLWTVTKFTGKDPQAAFNRAWGEVGDYPTSKKILICINIGF